MFKKAPNLEIFLQSKLKLDAEEGVGRLGSASGHELMIYEAPSLYSCIDRIRLNDCNLYFIRWISALYYTGGDNRLNMGSSTGAAESFLVSFFLFVMMMMMMMMMEMIRMVMVLTDIQRKDQWHLHQKVTRTKQEPKNSTESDQEDKEISSSVSGNGEQES